MYGCCNSLRICVTHWQAVTAAGGRLALPSGTGTLCVVNAASESEPCFPSDATPPPVWLTAPTSTTLAVSFDVAPATASESARGDTTTRQFVYTASLWGSPLASHGQLSASSAPFTFWTSDGHSDHDGVLALCASSVGTLIPAMVFPDCLQRRTSGSEVVVDDGTVSLPLPLSPRHPCAGQALQQQQQPSTSSVADTYPIGVGVDTTALWPVARAAVLANDTTSAPTWQLAVALVDFTNVVCGPSHPSSCLVGDGVMALSLSSDDTVTNATRAVYGGFAVRHAGSMQLVFTLPVVPASWALFSLTVAVTASPTGSVTRLAAKSVMVHFAPPTMLDDRLAVTFTAHGQLLTVTPPAVRDAGGRLIARPVRDFRC